MDGSLIQLDMQDRSTWDKALIGRGFFPGQIVRGKRIERVSPRGQYRRPALRCLYIRRNRLDRHFGTLRRSLPVASHGDRRPEPCRRHGQSPGPGRGIFGNAKVPDAEKLKDDPFFPAALAEFHYLAGPPGEAATHFKHAMKLARSPFEAQFFKSLLAKCRSEYA